MKEVDVVLFVEHADRELDAVTAIAERLAARGHSVVVLSSPHA